MCRWRSLDEGDACGHDGRERQCGNRHLEHRTPTQRLEPLGREEDETEQAQEGGANGQRPMTAHTQNTLSHANRCNRMPPMTGPSAMPTPDVPTRSPTASPRIGDPSNNPMMDDSVAPIKLCINITYL